MPDFRIGQNVQCDGWWTPRESQRVYLTKEHDNLIVCKTYTDALDRITIRGNIFSLIVTYTWLRQRCNASASILAQIHYETMAKFVE